MRFGDVGKAGGCAHQPRPPKLNKLSGQWASEWAQDDAADIGRDESARARRCRAYSHRCRGAVAPRSCHADVSLRAIFVGAFAFAPACGSQHVSTPSCTEAQTCVYSKAGTQVCHEHCNLLDDAGSTPCPSGQVCVTESRAAMTHLRMHATRRRPRSAAQSLAANASAPRACRRRSRAPASGRRRNATCRRRCATRARRTRC